jgi:hypothetical protein
MSSPPAPQDLFGNQTARIGQRAQDALDGHLPVAAGSALRPSVANFQKTGCSEAPPSSAPIRRLAARSVSSLEQQPRSRSACRWGKLVPHLPSEMRRVRCRMLRLRPRACVRTALPSAGPSRHLRGLYGPGISRDGTETLML